jgi:hypothetical protein
LIFRAEDSFATDAEALSTEIDRQFCFVDDCYCRIITAGIRRRHLVREIPEESNARVSAGF